MFSNGGSALASFTSMQIMYCSEIIYHAKINIQANGGLRKAPEITIKWVAEDLQDTQGVVGRIGNQGSEPGKTRTSAVRVLVTQDLGTFKGQ